MVAEYVLYPLRMQHNTFYPIYGMAYPLSMSYRHYILTMSAGENAATLPFSQSKRASPVPKYIQTADLLLP